MDHADATGHPGPPRGLTAYVTERIQDDLSSGFLVPGETIKQTVLAKRYGVSPTPVREALRILQSNGVIRYSPHKGASVRELSPESARDLYRLRAGAERVAAEMAVERMTPEGLRAIEKCHADLGALLEDPQTSAAQLSVANKELHFALYRLSSAMVVRYLDLLWARFTPTSTVFIDREVARDQHAEHEAIVKAVRDGDATLAGRLVADHILDAATKRERLPAARAAGEDEGTDFAR